MSRKVSPGLIKRGANIVGVYNGTGITDYGGSILNIDNTATLTANLINSTNGHLIIELRKGS